MKIRPWAEFTSDFPDDHIEDDDEIVQYGGKSVAEAIGEMLVRCGCEVSAPRYADEHGWELDIVANKRRLWCQVTLIDKYLMVMQQNSWIANTFGRLHPTYVEVLKGLGMELAKDARFHDVRWFERNDIHSEVEGARSPVED